MILADSSVWIDHLRLRDAQLATALEEGRVLVHPFVIGELACGTLRHRQEVLDLLHRLPFAPMATDQEALMFIDRHRLMGTGVGFVDVHLLASTALAAGAAIWTRDRRLANVAIRLKLAHHRPS